MNVAIAQFLGTAGHCFSSHDSAIAQQLRDALTSFCGRAEAHGVAPSPLTIEQEVHGVGPPQGMVEQDTCRLGPSRYPPKLVPACALLPASARLSPQPVMRHLLACHQVLAWRRPGFGRLPPSLSDHLAVSELVGPDGMYPDDNIRFGVLLQAGNVHYPVHQHAAEELYYVLHGTAGWGEHPMRLQRKPAGEFIHHRPLEPHCISTGSEPLLALWGWTGEINSASYAVNSA